MHQYTLGGAFLLETVVFLTAMILSGNLFSQMFESFVFKILWGEVIGMKRSAVGQC